MVLINYLFILSEYLLQSGVGLLSVLKGTFFLIVPLLAFLIEWKLTKGYVVSNNSVSE